MRHHGNKPRLRTFGTRPVLILTCTCSLALFAGARGAVPQPAWVPLGPVGLPRVYQAVFDPLLPNVAYAAVEGGVSRSEDGGFYWRFANQGLPEGLFTMLLTVSPTGHLFALGASGQAQLVNLFESADGARSWHQVNLPASIAEVCSGVCGQPFLALAFDKRDADTFYLAGDNPYRGGIGGLFRTRDHGATWERLAEALASDALSVAVDPLSPRHLYVGLHYARQGAGLYISHDGGATWARALRGVPTAIQVSPVDPAVVWAARPGSIVTSKDRGVGWSTVLDTGTFLNGVGFPATPLLADVADAATAYVGNRLTKTTSAFLKTTDGGRHWRALTQGLPADPYILAIAQFSLDPSRLMVSELRGGVYGSQDGGSTWSKGGYGLADSPVTALAATPKGVVYESTFNTVLQLAADGSTWTRVLYGPFLPVVGALTIDPTNPRTIYSGIIDSPEFDGGTGVLYKSTDGGTTWDNLPVPGASLVTDLVVDPHAHGTVYAAASTVVPSPGVVLKSIDGGETWTVLAGPQGAGELALDASTNPSTVYLANGHLLKSSDAGETWTTLAVDIGGKEVHALTHLALTPSAPRFLYALSEEQGATIVRSSDGGASWAFFSQRRNHGAAPPPNSHHPIAVDPVDPTVLFVGWSAGVTQSVDGAPWTELGSGLPPSPVQTLIVSGRQLLVGTATAGAFAFPLGGLAPPVPADSRLSLGDS